MWDLRPTAEYERRLKQYVKKRPRETRAVLGNLKSFVEALNAGARPRDVRTGFIHPEPGGVLAVTEQGAGKSTIPLRLYVYPHPDGGTLHLVTLGGKATQAEDVLFCKRSIEFLRTEGQVPDVQ